jgi:hypothetical protein
VLDLINIVNHGFICISWSKLAEHGGFAHDNRKCEATLMKSRRRHDAPSLGVPYSVAFIPASRIR